MRPYSACTEDKNIKTHLRRDQYFSKAHWPAWRLMELRLSARYGEVPGFTERFLGLTLRLRLKENFDRFNFALHKENEMVASRRWFFALAVVILFSGLANAHTNNTQQS